MTFLTWRGADRKVLARILIVAGIGIPIGFGIADVLPERGLGISLGFLLITVAGVMTISRNIP